MTHAPGLGVEIGIPRKNTNDERVVETVESWTAGEAGISRFSQHMPENAGQKGVRCADDRFQAEARRISVEPLDRGALDMSFGNIEMRELDWALCVPCVSGTGRNRSDCT